MKFGGFYEHQIPRPWTPETEHQFYKEAIAQVELSDRLGFDYAWATEHHFLEEYAHSSAPEVFLAACSQRTKNIRLGHGIVHMSPWVNHPARIAERIATLDLVSDGRCEFGTGEGANNTELGGYLVPQEEKRAMWLEGITCATRMMVEEPFAGFEGKYLKMPVRNIVPKPYQKPHPPLWLACSRRDTIHFAAKLGLGSLAFAFASPEEAGQWVADYYATIENESEPIGYAVNPQLGITCHFLCDRNEERVRKLALEHHGYFHYGLGHYGFFGEHEPGKVNLWERYKNDPKHFDGPIGKVRDCIGTPDQIRAQLREFEAAGVDQVIFLSQAGKLSHDYLCSSMELFAKEVMPEFKEREQKHAKEKAERAARISEKAMARKKPPEIPNWPPTKIKPAGHP